MSTQSSMKLHATANEEIARVKQTISKLSLRISMGAHTLESSQRFQKLNELK